MITEDIFTAVKTGVAEYLGGDDSGHGMDHIDRVEAMTVRFCGYYQGEVDCGIARLAALLHDVDDYKLVGRENAGKLFNATAIMTTANIEKGVQRQVIEIVANMGYSKSLRGIRPTSIEGMIVSDADMCDAIGASGVVRALEYAVSDKGSGVVFDQSVMPNLTMAAHEYNAKGTSHDGDSFINHFFEKMLKIRDIMLTVPGGEEAAERDVVMVQFLRAFFREQNAPEWIRLLDDYLSQRDQPVAENGVAREVA